MSLAFVTALAMPSRSSRFVPVLVAEVTGPGTAPTGRPRRRACSATDFGVDMSPHVSSEGYDCTVQTAAPRRKQDGGEHVSYPKLA